MANYGLEHHSLAVEKSNQFEKQGNVAYDFVAGA